jgi:hypothetical protein
MKSKMFIRCAGLLLLASLNLAMTFPPTAMNPVTGGAAPLEQETAASIPTLPTLDDFTATLTNGQANQVVGVYVPKVLALRVAQQPAHNLAYVTENPDYVTQFGLAAQYGTTGLLAHNYLSGSLFFNLLTGQEVDTIYGDGSIRRYSISSLRHFQALSPTDPSSNFVDIDGNNGTQISNADLFQQIYAAGDRVVFQTCITAAGNTSWGRLFVIATPLPLPSKPDQIDWITVLQRFAQSGWTTISTK